MASRTEARLKKLIGDGYAGPAIIDLVSSIYEEVSEDLTTEPVVVDRLVSGYDQTARDLRAAIKGLHKS